MTSKSVYRWSNYCSANLLWFGKDRNKDRGVLTENPTMCKIARSIFAYLNIKSSRACETNRLEEEAENWYGGGLAIVENPHQRTEA